MNPRLMALALSAVLVTGVGGIPAFGQAAEVTITTDKESYMRGEAIIVTGNVLLNIQQPVSIQILDPIGNRVGVAQSDLAANLSYSAEFTAGEFWKKNGVYTIMAAYGGESRVAETTFELTGLAPVDLGSGTSIELEGFNIGYTITGGTLLSITPNEDGNSIDIEIEADRDGTLTIDFPREVIDARTDGCDGEDDVFIILIDGEEAAFLEDVKDDSRELTIDFVAGSEQIEIIGTCVIPEFGAIAVLVLAAAVVAIIAVSARSRLAFIPRY